MFVKQIYEAQIEFLNHSKRQFLAEQKQKIEQLKKYLDDRYLHIVCQYNLAYEKDLILNKNKIDTVSEKIHENMHHIKKIQKLRDEFITLANDGESQQNHEDIKSFRGGVPIGDIQTIESKIIKNFVKTGKFLDYYNYIKDKNQQKAQKNVQKVFTTHAIDSVKYLSINVEKDIQFKSIEDVSLQLFQLQGNTKSELEMKPLYQTMKMKMMILKTHKMTFQFYNINIVRNLKIRYNLLLKYYGKKKFEFRFEGYLFAIGGKNREDKLLKHCEKYDLKSKQWYQIASLNESRMNASVCAFSQKEGIFVFGGEDLEGYYLNSIEQYLINENKWITLEIQMPSPVSNQVAYKVSKRKILLLGGMKIQESTTSNSGFAKKVISADVYSFNISLDHSLREPVLSLYPCYQIQDGDFGNLIRASYVNTSRPVTRADINTPNSNNQNTPNANIAVQFGNTLSSNLTNQGSAVGTKSAAVSFKSTVGVKKEDKDEACIYLVSEGKHDTNPTIVPYPIKSFLPGGDNY